MRLASGYLLKHQHQQMSVYSINLCKSSNQKYHFNILILTHFITFILRVNCIYLTYGTGLDFYQKTKN